MKAAGKVWSQYVRPLKKHPYKYLLGSLEGLEHMTRFTERWAYDALYKHKASGNPLMPFAFDSTRGSGS